MGYDSTIRLRQLNQAELSGFVSGIFNLFPKPNVSGSLIPSGSGVFNVGSLAAPYAQIFANQLNLASGTGINFGNTSFNAYTSGGNAYINIGGIIISSSGEDILIQGPSGIAGPSGSIGPSGATGVGINGISYDTSTNILTFNFSNNTSTGFNFQGLSGATGVSVTGFFQSGGFIYPQYDHFQGTGKAIALLAGPQGPLGGINLFFQQQGINYASDGVNFPAEVIINPYYDSSVAPNISLMWGMSYTMDASGLNTHTLTSDEVSLITLAFSGFPPFSAGDQINYFVSGDQTGYWRFSFFPDDTPTGFYSTATNPSIFTDTTNFEVYGNNFIPNLYRTNLSFVTSFTAQPQYKYGFMVYTLGGEDSSTDVIITSPTGYAYVLGEAFISSGAGPVGPQGIQGPAGTGIQGMIGPSGEQGNDGNSVVSYNQQQIGPNTYQLQFIFSDGSLGPWVNMPSGGPTGVSGPRGLPGSLTNIFSGQYSGNITYFQNDTIAYNGSTYVYVNASPTSGNIPPNMTYWQLLAQSGAVGATGATGYADHYSANFSVISGIPTGVGTFGNSITGITVNSTGLSGTGAVFKIGQLVAFTNSGLSNYAYSPNQNIIFSSNTNTGSFLYGTVNSYNSSNGTLSFVVASGGTGINNVTQSGNYFLWYNYGLTNVNLGANLMSGAQGTQGIQGIQGPPGTAQSMRTQSYFANSGNSLIFQPTGTNITGGSGIDVFCVMITGNGIQYFGNQSVNLDVNWNFVQTGQSLLIKVRNSGVPVGNGEPPLFYFSGVNTTNASMIKWPNGVYTRPDDGQAYIYTILRFPDEFGKISVYGTYSNPYS